MENPLTTRVAARLAELNLKPSSNEIKEALEREGLNGTYIYELIAGRKAGVPQSKIPALARVLGVSSEYLNGVTSAGYVGVEIVGIAEAGAWRATGLQKIDGPLIAPDSRVHPDQQVAYLVQGDHAEALGIRDSSVIVVAKGIVPRGGEVVLSRRLRPGNLAEHVITKYPEDKVQTVEGTASIVGIVLLAVQRF